MSSARTTGGATAAAGSKRYLCYQCNLTFTLTPSDAATGLHCSHCRSDFVEEFDLPPAPNPNPNPNFGAFEYGDDFYVSPGALLLSDLLSLVSFAAGDSAGRQARQAMDAGASQAFDPFDFLQERLEMLARDGVEVFFGGVGDDGAGGGPFVGNIGDYFIGPGLEQLMQQLAENDPNRYGTPPASKTAVESLPDVKVTEGMMMAASDEVQCSVCMDAFELSEVVKQMPCKHLFHEKCILPWLELHNSCPVCRYELPTDDPDYEQQKASAGSATNPGGGEVTAGAGAGAAAEEVTGTRQRRSRISLAWPFGEFVWNGEGSNSGSSNSQENPAHRNG